nr:MAG TPA: hypothetical protein [Caudoviricetes sp.]
MFAKRFLNFLLVRKGARLLSHPPPNCFELNSI